ncbi:MAG: glycosidase [Myxococcota bacterium]|jgi:glycosidase
MLRAATVVALVLLFAGCTETRTLAPVSDLEDAFEADGDTGTTSDGDDVAPDSPDSGPEPADAEKPGDTETPEDAGHPADGSEVADSGPEQPDVAKPEAPADRQCVTSFTYQGLGDEQSVHVAGQFNAWSTEDSPLVKGPGNLWTLDLDTSNLTPASYAYKIVVNGDQWQLDPATPMRMIDGEVENSKVRIPDCRTPLLTLESLQVSLDSIDVVVAVAAGANQNGIDASSAAVVHGFAPMGESGYDSESQRFTVHIDKPAAGKHSLRFDIANAEGKAEPLFLPIWVEAQPFEWRDAVLYFAMTDRFADGDPQTGAGNDCLPGDNKANWQGGDWKGVQQKIEAGYFEGLGVDTIWLTAVVDNPEGCFQGLLGKQYTSYHGYFPSGQTEPEGHLGTMQDLRDMVSAAHQRGLRVLVDLVANHLHDSHPFVSANPHWFHDYLSCGGGGFENAPIECWFESYLPDIDYRQDAVVEEMSEAALWWVREADLDGFRIDAVKHMHDNFVRTLRHRIQEQLETIPGAVFWTVGETFTGDWGGGSGPNETTIKKYVAPHMLHGQFDFPMYWRLLQVFARGESSPLGMTDLLEQSFGYYGADALMSNFLGNHDVPRFMSHAAGQIGDMWGNGAKEQGWDAPPQWPTDAEPYERLKLAWSFLFTINGAPLIYYGDEIGMPGAGDPDNRRPMVFDGWNDKQQAIYDHIGVIAAVRRAHPALSRGSYKTLATNDAILAYERSLDADRVVVLLNVSNTPRSIGVSIGAGTWTDALSGQLFESSDGTTDISVDPWGAHVLAK